jgi:hypothetical protein
MATHMKRFWNRDIGIGDRVTRMFYLKLRHQGSRGKDPYVEHL